MMVKASENVFEYIENCYAHFSISRDRSQCIYKECKEEVALSD